MTRLAIGEPIEVRMTTHDGTRLWVPAVVKLIQDAKIEVVYSDGRCDPLDSKHYRRSQQHG